MDCRSNKPEKTLLILSGELRIQTPPLGSASPLLRHEIGAAWVMKSAYPHDRENNTFWVPDAYCCRACRLVDDTGLRHLTRTLDLMIPERELVACLVSCWLPHRGSLGRCGETTRQTWEVRPKRMTGQKKKQKLKMER